MEQSLQLTLGALQCVLQLYIKWVEGVLPYSNSGKNWGRSFNCVLSSRGFFRPGAGLSEPGSSLYSHWVYDSHYIQAGATYDFLHGGADSQRRCQLVNKEYHPRATAMWRSPHHGHHGVWPALQSFPVHVVLLSLRLPFPVFKNASNEQRSLPGLIVETHSICVPGDGSSARII